MLEGKVYLIVNLIETIKGLPSIATLFKYHFFLTLGYHPESYTTVFEGLFQDSKSSISHPILSRKYSANIQKISGLLKMGHSSTCYTKKYYKYPVATILNIESNKGHVI